MTELTYLEVDLTGKNKANYFEGEVITLTQVPNRKHRVAVTCHGLFYSDSLVVRKTDGTLIDKKDYKTTFLHPVMSELTGQEIKAMIVITNPSIDNSIRISYQAVGLNGGLNVKQLKSALLEIANDNLEFTLDDIVGLPDAYVPKPHMNKWWQIYGLESMIENIDRISKMWPNGTKPLIDENLGYAAHFVDLIDTLIADYKNAVMQHINDFNNPHKVNKTQIGLELLNNWPMANVDQILDGVNNAYLPIGGVFHQLNATLIPDLNKHLTNYKNPHELTLEMLGLLSYAEIDDLYRNKLKRGTTAASSKLLGGYSSQQLYDATRKNLDASNIKPNTLFKRQRLAVDHPDFSKGHSNYALAGDNIFRDLSDLFKEIGIDSSSWVYSWGNHGSRAAAWNTIVGTAADPGTYIFAKYKLSGYRFSDSWYIPDIAVGQRLSDGSTRSIV